MILRRSTIPSGNARELWHFLLTAIIYKIIGRDHSILIIIIINQKVNIRIECGEKCFVVFKVFTKTGSLLFQMYLSMVIMVIQSNVN